MFGNFNRRNFLIGASAALAAPTLAACGGSDDPASGSGGNGGSSGSGVELTYMFRGGEDERKAYDQAIKAFEDETGAKVKVIVTDADSYRTKLQAAITGNQTPDVFYLEQGAVMAFAKNGVVKDITADIETAGIEVDKVWKYGVDSYRFDGSKVGEGALYGLPKDIGPFSFGYNKTMFEKAGIALPDKDTPYTWAEFRDVAKQLTTGEQWGTGLNVTWNLQAWVWSNGGDWADADRRKVAVDTPEFAEAFQDFADIQLVDKSTPSVEQAQTMDTYQRWMRGQIGFFPVGPWDVSTYAKLPFDWDLIPYPVGSTGKTATWVGSLGIAVSSKTKNSELAAQLAMFLSANEETQRQLYKAGVQIPNLVDMAHGEYAESEGMPENKIEFVQIAEEYGRALPAATTWSGEWYDEFWVGIQPVLDGKISAADYCKDVQPRMQQKLDAANQAAGI
ncbi:sugar ABC transporter substrate-binding protein [Tessaracoccus sp. MC1865]|uniref:ABC transporter substrate-binding protein n=1 Tax=Tessaracoccus sp. MC1865 TaxID=2760310 RepID=UPI0016016061|nr:sugar ABC transporter substrate-binding protein [Tessaracoccus sp. MC1865]MBB1484422.1 sugar ABC transporter substrate-binding protein [Tessaracoccus sp. MC1865]QTO38473.1 sugar ABC transporter substrate-binding protein [Tessaracoccus sp. MC1865]